MRLLDMAKSTTPTPLSLLISCILSFPIVGLKMPSLLILALKFSIKILISILNMLREFNSATQKKNYFHLSAPRQEEVTKCLLGSRVRRCGIDESGYR
jgi:hypothetical protein